MDSVGALTVTVGKQVVVLATQVTEFCTCHLPVSMVGKITALFMALFSIILFQWFYMFQQQVPAPVANPVLMAEEIFRGENIVDDLEMGRVQTRVKPSRP